ncbi:hypothetical protein B0H17DRAFT_1147185 [Mycena rosella]|uniref:Uncharacterized protein n=1 Tax=Mycena rosella TaxID=1033263 RepID=A0AAD7CMD3_MYCRO|nr:hypothetical protein B0H17DRAFT_1147185 [Mycena rosella]
MPSQVQEIWEFEIPAYRGPAIPAASSEVWNPIRSCQPRSNIRPHRVSSCLPPLPCPSAMASFLLTNHNGNKCSLCGTTLIPKLATGSPEDILHLLDASPPMLSTSQMTDNTPTTSTAPRCADATCGSKRIDKGCCHAMCRRHCNVVGPCTLIPHEQNRWKKSSSQAAQTRPPPPVLTLPSFDPWIGFSTSLDEFQTNAMRPPRVLEQCEARERSRLAEEERNLDQRLELALGVRSPSLGLSLEEDFNLMDAQLEKEEIDTLFQQQADVRCAQEIKDFQLALQLSREDSQQLSADAAALTPSQPVATTLAGRVIHRPAAAIVLAHPASTLSSIFHIKSGGSRHIFANPQLTEQFTLIFLLPNEGPKVLCVDRVPRWPSYQLSADPKTLVALAMALSEDLDDLDELNVLLQKQRVWMGINITFVHTVSTDSVVMLRCHGTPGQHEDEMIQKFISDNSAVHLRLNLHQERAAVQTTTKARGLITVDESDSDIEVIKEPKVSRKQDYGVDGSPPLRRQRRRLSVLSNGPVATMDDSPQPSTISLVSPPPHSLRLHLHSQLSSTSQSCHRPGRMDVCG